MEMSGRRMMSVSVNEVADGSHTIMLKRGGIKHEISLSEDLIKKRQEGFRKILERNVSAGGDQPRFPVNGPRTPEFDDVIRELARYGRDTFKAMHRPEAPEGLRAELRGVRDL